MADRPDLTAKERQIQDYLRTGKISPGMVWDGIRSCFTDPFISMIANLRGPVGYKMREIYYKTQLKSMGRNVLIDIGVVIHGAENISIGDFSWIDAHSILVAPRGHIQIGKRIHVAPGAYLIGSGELEIHDYVGIAPHAKVLSSSEYPVPGMRMSGPMLPMECRGIKYGKVVLEKDAFVGSNSIIMPGVVIGEGAVVSANSIVNKSVEPFTIVFGAPAKKIGRRKPITVPDV